MKKISWQMILVKPNSRHPRHSHHSCMRLAMTVGVAIAMAILLNGCSDRATERYYQGSSMGTSWSLKLVEDIEDTAFDGLVADVQAELDRVEQMMSTYIPQSEISRFNQSRSTAWQAVSPDMISVVAMAQAISKLTDGAFDITVAPLVKLWGFFDQKIEDRPSPTQIEKVKSEIGYQHLSFRKNPPALRKDIPTLSIDLSAIAKGYAVDRAVAILQHQQYKNYLIEVGGELRASGLNKYLQVWRIGVEKPVPGWREVMREVQLNDIGIATSGDYRNFIEIDGSRYSHEIDPRQGLPLMYRGGSVTVIAPTTMLADAWATGLFVLGKDKGMPLARQQGLAVYYIEQTDDGFVQIMNKKFSHYLTGEAVQ